MRGEQCAFPALLAGYDAVQDWIQQNRYEAIEAPREVWYEPPGETAEWDIVWLSFSALPSEQEDARDREQAFHDFQRKALELVARLTRGARVSTYAEELVLRSSTDSE